LEEASMPTSSQVQGATAAAVSTASELGLVVADASVLHDSNRTTLRLLPCDVLARVVPIAYQASAEFEVALARQLAATGSPVAVLEPRVEPRAYTRDGYVINFWAYYEPLPQLEIPPAEYARALERLHAGMRQIEITTPHFTDRVAEAQSIAGSRDRAPDLTDDDRELLTSTLLNVTRAIADRATAEQLLHGEPHPGNLLRTKNGPLFIDLETCCRGPVEFDIADAPEEVAEHYPGLDGALLRECRVLALALVAAWRWDRHDRFPNRDEERQKFLSELRAASEGLGLDD
jgi:hypothetical protein